MLSSQNILMEKRAHTSIPNLAMIRYFIIYVFYLQFVTGLLCFHVVRVSDLQFIIINWNKDAEKQKQEN